MRIYLDSNVLISAIRGEIGKNYRLLAEEAKKFFEYAGENGHTLVISDFFIFETHKYCFMDKEKIAAYFNERGINTEFVSVPKYTSKRIIQLGIHTADAIHITTALENNCDAIATFNRKDFEKAKNLIRIIDFTSL